MTDSQKYRMRLIRAHLDHITSTINDIDPMLNSLIIPYENAVQLLCTIPGVDHNSAITRAGVYPKPALVQVVHVAVKSAKTSYYKKI